MIFATVLSLCLSIGDNTCNDYIVDVATTQSDCMDNLIVQSTRMASVWTDDAKLAYYLKTFNVVEPIPLLNDYDYTCKPIADKDIP